MIIDLKVVSDMRIEELGGEEEGLEIAERPEEEEKEVAKSAASGEAVHNVGDSGGGGGGGGDIVLWSTKKVLVGAGARALFYPTLLYNVVRNKVQAEFRWWDWIDEVYYVQIFVEVFYSIVIVTFIVSIACFEYCHRLVSNGYFSSGDLHFFGLRCFCCL